MRRLRALLDRLLGRKPTPELGKVTYETGRCQQCGGDSAVINGSCWYCRTGNEPVTEPMVWSGD